MDEMNLLKMTLLETSLRQCFLDGRTVSEAAEEASVQRLLLESQFESLLAHSDIRSLPLPSSGADLSESSVWELLAAADLPTGQLYQVLGAACLQLFVQVLC